MSDYITDNLPNDLKIEIFNNCTYVSKFLIYSFLKEFDTSSELDFNILSKELNKYIENKDLEDLILLNNDKILDKILQIKPQKFYLDTFLKVTDKILTLASKFGADKIINWYYHSVNDKNDRALEKLCCYLALSNGNIKCLKLLKSKNFKWGSDIFLACSKNNNFELFKSMMETNLDIDECLTPSKVNGNDKVIKEILTINSDINIKDKYFVNSFHVKKHLDKIYNSVCKNCNIEFIEYLYKLYPQIKSTNIAKCINKKNIFENSIKVIKWTMTQLHPMTVDYCNRAASVGNLELLIWLREKGFPWDQRIITNACRGGYIKIFEYITNYKNLVNVSDLVMLGNNLNLLEYAAESNNLNFVKMLHLKGYKITTTGISYSIISNNFDIFKYFLDQEDLIKFNQMELFDLSLQSDNEQFILELIKRGLFINDGPIIYLKCFNKLKNKLNTIKLLDNILEIGKHLSYTIVDNNYDIFLWYLEKYNNILTEDINIIIKNDNRKLLEWIINNEGDIFIIKDLIVNNKKLDYINYVKGIMTPEDYKLINRDSNLDVKTYKQKNAIEDIFYAINYLNFGKSLY